MLLFVIAIFIIIIIIISTINIISFLSSLLLHNYITAAQEYNSLYVANAGGTIVLVCDFGHW